MRNLLQQQVKRKAIVEGEDQPEMKRSRVGGPEND
jgi:hypothetical protein